jgi:hypothetical protein
MTSLRLVADANLAADWMPDDLQAVPAAAVELGSSVLGCAGAERTPRSERVEASCPQARNSSALQPEKRESC